MAKVRCAFCKDYVDKEKAVPQGISFFCSDEHREAKRQKGYSAAKETTAARRSIPKKTKKKRSEPTPQTKAAVHAADLGRCRMCGSTYGLGQHHIHYRSEAGPVDHQKQNLITLCVDCHIPIVHGDKEKYQPLCLGVVWLREVYGDGDVSIKDVENWQAQGYPSFRWDSSGFP